jgi:hypothetical protein
MFNLLLFKPFVELILAFAFTINGKGEPLAYSSVVIFNLGPAPNTTTHLA